MNIEKHFFYNNKNQKLSAKIYSNQPASENGVIFCHGLFSTKDGTKITKMAEDIVNADFTLMTFDFSFCGESEGNISELSILQEVDDLNGAFAFFKKKYNINNLHLIGSSMGGLVSLLFSSIIGSEICSQSLIAAPVLIYELMKGMTGTEIENLPETGYTEVDGINIHNGFFKEAGKIDIEKVIENTNIPTLIIQGGKDTSVPVYNASVLIKNLKCEKRLILIEDGDHHLYRDTDIEILTDNILEWLTTHNFQ